MQTGNRGQNCGAEGTALFKALSNWTQYSGPLTGHRGGFSHGGNRQPPNISGMGGTLKTSCKSQVKRGISESTNCPGLRG